MAQLSLQSKLPVTKTFEAKYLEYYLMLPLELAEDRLRVAVAGLGVQIHVVPPDPVGRCPRRPPGTHPAPGRLDRAGG
jgi:hypothetical protein